MGNVESVYLGMLLYDAHKLRQKERLANASDRQHGQQRAQGADLEDEPPPLPVSISPASSEEAHYEEARTELTKSGLTILLPKSGYFVAGAVAGGVSRTATAPLDRLKVYLLVNTKTAASVVLDAAKKGQPLTAVRSAGRPVAEAIAALYKAGGLRTFFAGM